MPPASVLAEDLGAHKSTASIRLTIVHRDLVFAEMLSAFIQNRFLECSVMVFRTGREAVGQMVSLKSDVCLFAIDGIEIDVQEFLDLASAAKVQTRFVVLVAEENEQLIGLLKHIRVDCLLDLCTESVAGVLRALELCISARHYVSPRFEELFYGDKWKIERRLHMLTPTESLVLASIGVGESNEEIAGHLGTSVATVQTHRKHIMKKLGVRRESETVAQAFRLGLVKASNHELTRPGFRRAYLSRRKFRLKQ